MQYLMILKRVNSTSERTAVPWTNSGSTGPILPFPLQQQPPLDIMPWTIPLSIPQATTPPNYTSQSTTQTIGLHLKRQTAAVRRGEYCGRTLLKEPIRAWRTLKVQ